MSLPAIPSQGTFFYKAVTSNGTMVTGSAEGESIGQISRHLKKQGLIPIQVGDAPRKALALMPSIQFKSQRNVALFLSGMANLLGAGMPLDRALAMTGEAATNQQFRTAIRNVLSQVRSGKPLSESMAGHPAFFSSLHVNMVKAGEIGGSLATVFERLSEFEKNRNELRNYLTTSLLYPALLSVVGLMSIVMLLQFVVPRFAAVFESSHVAVPLPMALLLACNRLLSLYGTLGLVVVLTGFVLCLAYISTPRGKLWWDAMRLKLPWFGEFTRKAETSRFARAMGTLAGNSVPLVQSIATARTVLRNERIALSLDAVTQSVKRGEGIAAPFARCGEFPKLAADLLAMGEETGRLDAMFIRMADMYERETRAAIGRFTALFEPLVILMVGIAVGAIILSMLVAITSVNNVAVL